MVHDVEPVVPAARDEQQPPDEGADRREEGEQGVVGRDAQAPADVPQHRVDRLHPRVRRVEAEGEQHQEEQDGPELRCGQQRDGLGEHYEGELGAGLGHLCNDGGAGRPEDGSFVRDAFGRHWNGNRRPLEGNRRRLEDNRRRLEGNRPRLEGNRRRLEGNRRRLEGNRWRLEDH